MVFDSPIDYPLFWIVLSYRYKIRPEVAAKAIHSGQLPIHSIVKRLAALKAKERNLMLTLLSLHHVSFSRKHFFVLHNTK